MLQDKDKKATDTALSTINREQEEKDAQCVAKELNIPYVDIGAFPINPDVLRLVKQEEAKSAHAMPFFKAGKKVRVAVSDPNNSLTQTLLKDLESKGYAIQTHLASGAGLMEAFTHYAADLYRPAVEPKNTVEEEEIHYEKELENLAHIKEKIATLPAEEALNLLHVSAIKAGASDMHYQPHETGCTLRFRIDGVLHPVFDFSREVFDRIAGQLKYKAGMKLNIANVPQDGRFRFIVNERKIDVRVATLPTEYGESFVLRILDSGKHFAALEELGFSGNSLSQLKKAAELSQGMILVTGPTSSGKTTTLYVLLQAFNKPELNIITLEDPIEYHLKGITQSQVNEKRGYTFAGGLKSILRQDPDVVMIGEIRDLETAEVSVQAALTGHVLLSTIHTKSAVDTIPRLLTLGVQNFLVGPALSFVTAQRLVRRLCTCAVSRKTTDEERAIFEKILQSVAAADASPSVRGVPENVKRPKGCEECNVTGYRGQMVVSEVLEVDDEIETAILKGASAPEILAMAKSKGMVTMYEDAVLKTAAGFTTLEEVHRVINA